jgi:bifunctional non-homologous end joining protein LigD
MADRLDSYRRKRDPGRTPEPFGHVRPDSSGARLFVVQQHAARRLHWDFRLELHGTLRSWAVPKGPSADPGEKRMAIEVEDHPIEYADFEGSIPKGNYGAGSVIVWDRGWWRALEDPDAGYEAGKLLFELGGYKLRGEWTLVRTRSAREWLLLKHRDRWADPGGLHPFPDVSILSGRLLEEVAGGSARTLAALERAALEGAPRRPLRASEVAPMLAQPGDAPFRAEGWLFELKYDGYRLIAWKEGARVTLRYRRGGDATALFPEVARAVAALPVEEAVLDGELVVLDPSGRPDFQALQGRGREERVADIAAASITRPATLFVFDLLAAGGLDLRPLPLVQRKAVLAALAPRLGPVRYADHVETEGEALFREVTARGLEGVVAKRGEAPYRAGRSPAWVKIRTERTGDFAVVGFTAPARGRTGFGALHLAARGTDGLRYAGRVGTGFDEPLLRELHGRLASRVVPAPAGGGPHPTGKGPRWVEPELVAEVRFKEWTKEGILRQPVFIRLRDDKRLDEIDALATPSAEPPSPAPTPQAGPREIEISNPAKIYFPRDAITKGELVDYYRTIAPAILPLLRDRPVVLTRFPDGIDGKSFFQKDTSLARPAWLRTVTVRSEESDRDLELALLDDAEGLAWAANLGAIPIHVPASRAGSMERPDWLVVDLDPKGAPFAHVVRLARAIHALCDELGLPSFPKTSGQAGLHVLVPTGGQLTHEQARTLALLLCRAIESTHGEIATTVRAVRARGGRVYLDAFQNGAGKTIAAPYCVRPRDGAPVSTPLRWSEVNARLDPARFTIRTVPARLRRLGADPLLPILDARPDLVGALQRLSKRLGPSRGAFRSASAQTLGEAIIQSRSISRTRAPSSTR